MGAPSPAIHETAQVGRTEELPAATATHETGGSEVAATHQDSSHTPEETQVEDSRIQDRNAPRELASEQQQESIQTVQRPRKRPRRVSRVALSPTALLAPEVGGTPCKDDATPVKSAQKAWRDLCAKEAARLRLDASAPEREVSPDGSSASDKDEADSEASCPGSPDSSRSSHSSASSDSHEACDRSPLSRSRSLSQEVDVAKRPKLILRKRRSVLERDAAAASAASCSRSPIRRL